MKHEAAITSSPPRESALAPSDSRALEDAFDACRAIVRDRARNFYYGLRISPEPERSAVFALYAWMRAADDTVDDAGDIPSRRRRLESFWNDTQRMLEGKPPDGSPMWRAFAHVARRYRLDPDVLEDVIRGMRTDLDAEARARETGEPELICATRDDLSTYCHRVASTVGLCCVRIWGLEKGVEPSEADELAIARGRAFQLTNMLRDYAEDYDEGRVYLPSEDFQRAGLAPSDLRAWTNPEACTELVDSIASWAEAMYRESDPLVAMVNDRCAPTLEAMSRIYRGLLTKIRKEPSAIVSTKRIRLSPVTKVAIALKSVRAARRVEAE